MYQYSNDDVVIVSLQSEAKELEAIEDGLLKRLREVQYTLGSVRSRIGSLLNRGTPVLQLPDEILGQIFAYGDPTYTKDSLPSHVLASHVSQRWRHLILHDPSLWTHIARQPHTPGYPLGLLHAHLTRSLTLPLHISCGEESDAAFTALAAHAHRWASFEDTELDVVHSRVLLRLAGLCVPVLRSLVLWVAAAPGMPSAPALESLTIAGAMLAHVRISFASLTVLRIVAGGTLGAIQDALAGLPALQTLKFGDFGSFADRREGGPVDVPSLTTLEIGWAMSCGADELPVLFSAIRTPRLETLVLRHVDGAQVAPLEAWLHPGRFPCLRSLTLQEVPATPRLIRAFPGVEHVVVYANPYTDCCSVLETWLEPIAGEGEDSDPWPMLKSISIKTQYHQLSCDPSNIVASRIAAGRPLEKVSMDARILVEEDTVRWLKRRVQFEKLVPED
ncbi:hypothetical protein PLICRDRAFT_45946 [Plicaturopsis crispa FD-325 SS-3]|uniref:F-box domain-containing protein n=1 Tax=Plicaturopsis crispa FD-325 SS-3 TaxID=944288 RepID=A0A0C9SKZ0_PLICR|nr:hypothetical protein PLICRDRAFT_45946 [Plicaturopsis crispa FD-325 SS-3]